MDVYTVVTIVMGCLVGELLWQIGKRVMSHYTSRSK